MIQPFNRNKFKKKLTRQERNRIYSQPKPVTLWNMLDEKSKQKLLDIKARALIQNNAQD